MFYLYATMYEAPAMACRSKVWIFFCAGNCDPPYAFPGLVQLAVYRIHPWMVGGHSVPHVCGNTLLLKWQQTNKLSRWSITKLLTTWNSPAITLPSLMGWPGVEQMRKVDTRRIRDAINKTCHQGVREREAFDYASLQRKKPNSVCQEAKLFLTPQEGGRQTHPQVSKGLYFKSKVPL